jgi:membrane protease YdiL (CAAX protease family)
MNLEPPDPFPTQSITSSPVSPKNSVFPVWNGWDIVFLVFFTSFTILVFGTMGRAANHLLQVKFSFWAQLLKHPAGEGVSLLLFQVLLDGVILSYILLTIVLKYNAPFFPSIRWKEGPCKRWRNFLALGMGMAIVVLIVSSLYPPAEPPPVERLLQHPITITLYATLGVLVAPFVEEILFRGFIYPVLERRFTQWWGLTGGIESSFFAKISWGKTGAIVLTGLLFALLHVSQLWGSWAGTLLIFGVGLTLSAVRAFSGSVLPCFIIHLSYNSTICLLFFAGVLAKGFPR